MTSKNGSRKRSILQNPLDENYHLEGKTQKKKQINYRKKQKEELEHLQEECKRIEKENKQLLIKEAILMTKSKLYRKQLKYFQDFLTSAISLANRTSSSKSINHLEEMGMGQFDTKGYDFILEDQKFDC
ncbi:hypothetical protein M0812_27488 [Anaeramoeba flamelloides]|uniref:BZIP domain-containing protein n=1 Tax=Anaeramoeba flamelloides TaxID=1746091 RepID=A0AAV7Y5E7_9EUKA|nr:hypothetical protein M0812_27488 [Anaeramoeba flamelloides]